MSKPRLIVVAVCSLMLAATQAFGGPIFSIATGSLTASRFISGSGEIDDVRGAVTLNVSDPGPLGLVHFLDSTGGTDPVFATLPLGNSSLNGADAGFTQLTTMLFDFGTSLLGPTSDTITAIGSAVIPNPTTDPALADTNQSLLFTFTLSNIVNPSEGVTLAQYTLTDVSAVASVPEPATAGGIALGLALLGYLGLRRRKAA